ncbi:hypothetical protein BGZ76_002023, partial [Entomortierella beljakovae]
LIYQDILSDDELFSDAFDIKDVGGAYEIDCQMIKIKADEVNTGANASVEEAEEALEDGEEIVNNVVHSGRLVATSFDKKAFGVYIKVYLKAVKAKAKFADEAEAKQFETEASAVIKKILANFKDYEFYTGESMNPDGALMFLNYREDGITPYFTVIKAGLREQKV